MSLKKSSANLGDKNIPKSFVQAGAPTQLMSLYWREEASNPPKTTVEIWMLADNTFLLVSGNFGDGEWTQDHLTFHETETTLEKAMYLAKQNYTFGPIEDSEIAQEEVEEVALTEQNEEQSEENPEEKTASKVKRLIRKEA